MPAIVGAPAQGLPCADITFRSRHQRRSAIGSMILFDEMGTAVGKHGDRPARVERKNLIVRPAVVRGPRAIARTVGRRLVVVDGAFQGTATEFGGPDTPLPLSGSAHRLMARLPLGVLASAAMFAMSGYFDFV